MIELIVHMTTSYGLSLECFQMSTNLTASGHVAILEWMLHHSLATGLEQDDFGATPVHDAAEQGQLECLHVFYNHSVDLNKEDCEGLTPM